MEFPCFEGHECRCKTLFDYLEGGDTLQEFLKGFPTVPRDLALEALEEARALPMAHC